MRVRDGLVLGVVVALVAVACASDEVVTDTTAAGAVQETESEGIPVDFVGAMEVTPKRGPAGTEVAVTGTELPANDVFDLTWFSADCDWVLEGGQNEDYMGRACTERVEVIDTVTSDGNGDLTASFVVPDDYGFGHDVALIDESGVLRNKTLFSLEIEVSVTPESGPVGTPITIEVRGMGYQSLEDTRTILYDNRYAGFMSAVTTRGTARATIPAVGSVGPHHIEINRGAYTFPYLNPQQSPRPDIPTFSATFTVTDGPVVLPPPIDEQSPSVVTQAVELEGDGPVIAADLVSGPVGAAFTVVGKGFAPGQAVALQWFRIVGNRVSGNGWEEKALDLGTVDAAADGTFTFATEVPGDVGGAHRIEASQGGDVLGDTIVTITPWAEPVDVASVTTGTEVVLHLTGVGWTETANIYTVVYDNSYVGYACGFNTQGDVQIPFTLTGDPGWHFIELYPAIYKGEEAPGRDNFRIPQLTAVDDHPGEDLPVFRYAFEIVG
jgi:hypothetical protein